MASRLRQEIERIYRTLRPQGLQEILQFIATPERQGEAYLEKVLRKIKKKTWYLAADSSSRSSSDDDEQSAKKNATNHGNTNLSI